AAPEEAHRARGGPASMPGRGARGECAEQCRSVQNSAVLCGEGGSMNATPYDPGHAPGLASDQSLAGGSGRSLGPLLAAALGAAGGAASGNTPPGSPGLHEADSDAVAAGSLGSAAVPAVQHPATAEARKASPAASMRQVAGAAARRVETRGRKGWK